jgi:hypothetical protein
LIEGYLLTIHDTLEGHKEYSKLETKLENRRLDFDAKLNKVQKSKKENSVLEEETRVCQSKYEETLEAITQKMIELNTDDDRQHHSLIQFVDQELEYFESCAKLLQGLKQSLFEDGPPAPKMRNGLNASTINRVSNGRLEMMEQRPMSTFGRQESFRQPQDPVQQISSRMEQSRIIERQATEPMIPVSRNLAAAAAAPAPPRPYSMAQNTQKQVKAVFDFDAEAPNELTSTLN